MPKIRAFKDWLAYAEAEAYKWQQLYTEFEPRIFASKQSKNSGTHPNHPEINLVSSRDLSPTLCFVDRGLPASRVLFYSGGKTHLIAKIYFYK